MRITAIWGSENINAGVFILTDEGELLYASEVKILTGTDEKGERLYQNTGDIAINNSFTDERYSFQEADLICKRFGCELVFKI